MMAPEEDEVLLLPTKLVPSTTTLTREEVMATVGTIPDDLFKISIDQRGLLPTIKEWLTIERFKVLPPDFKQTLAVYLSIFYPEFLSDLPDGALEDHETAVIEVMVEEPVIPMLTDDIVGPMTKDLLALVQEEIIPSPTHRAAFRKAIEALGIKNDWHTRRANQREALAEGCEQTFINANNQLKLHIERLQVLENKAERRARLESDPLIEAFKIVLETLPQEGLASQYLRAHIDNFLPKQEADAIKSWWTGQPV